MSTTLNDQIERSLSIVHEVIGKADLNVDNELIVSSAQEEILESYAVMLESRERELQEQMHRIVLEYSAKIAATRSLLRSIGRESEKRLVWKENIERSEQA